MSAWDEWRKQHEKPKRQKAIPELRTVEVLARYDISQEERDMINTLAKCSLSDYHVDFIDQMKAATTITNRQRNFLAGLYYAYRGQHKQPVIKPEGWK